MRIVFAGTPDFAKLALENIIAAKYDVVAVFTQPDRPSGRGMKLTPSPVKQAALAHNIPIYQPLGLRIGGKYDTDAQSAKASLESLAPDVMVVAAYGLILPQWVLDLPKYGCLNIHASLLPRWRGAAPIQRAIAAGDAKTGVTIMKMDAGLDTGALLLQANTPITNTTTAASLHDDLAQIGAKTVLQILAQLDSGIALVPVPQPEIGVTYAEKLQKSESLLDLNKTADELDRQIRAFNPFPGATIHLPGFDSVIKVWQAKAMPLTHNVTPGTVLNVSKAGIDMATGNATVLRLLELQKPSARRQAVESFIQSWDYQPKN